jgi:hypothetical protein
MISFGALPPILPALAAPTEHPLSSAFSLPDAPGPAAVVGVSGDAAKEGPGLEGVAGRGRLAVLRLAPLKRHHAGLMQTQDTGTVLRS